MAPNNDATKPPANSSGKSLIGWNCSSCTFFHRAPANRCAMCGELRGATRQEMRDFVMGKPIPSKDVGNVVELLSSSSPQHPPQVEEEQEETTLISEQQQKRIAATATVATKNDHGSNNNNKENNINQLRSSLETSSAATASNTMQPDSSRTNNRKRISNDSNISSYLVRKGAPQSSSGHHGPVPQQLTTTPTAAMHALSPSRQLHPQHNNRNNVNESTNKTQQHPTGNRNENSESRTTQPLMKCTTVATATKPFLHPGNHQILPPATHTSGLTTTHSVGMPHQRTPFTISQRQSYKPGPIPLCPETKSTWIYPENPEYETREYQFKITETALFYNTLVSLPTGLGKTLIAAVVLYNYYRWFPTGKVVFLAPTLPLVNQQVGACFRIMGLPECDTALLTGKMSPKDRIDVWQSRRIFFCTPQTVQKDWTSHLELAKSVVCIVLDEAHKASGDYAYTKVLDQLETAGAKFRVLGLSATPGTSIKAIQSVVQALRAVKLEVRSEEDEEVKQYLHQKHLEIVIVPKNDSQRQVETMLSNIVSPYLKKLREENALTYKHGGDATLTAFQVHKAREDYFKLPENNNKGYMHSLFSAAHKLVTIRSEAHQSLGGVRTKLFRLKNDPQRGFLSRIVKSDEFGQLLELVSAATTSATTSSSPSSKNNSTRNNPKLTKLMELLQEHFARAKACDRSSRAIVFSQFRDSVSEIVHVLKSLQPMVKPRHFVGQSKNNTSKHKQKQQNSTDGNHGEAFESLDGMNQSEQQQVIKMFREGTFNVLVCTSIGEEGLDIGEVDLIVNYDTLGSPIRMIQRTGRTGRARDGRVVSLISEGKEQNTYFASKSSEKTLYRALKSPGKFLMEPHQPMFPQPLPKVEKRVMEISEEIHLSQVMGAGATNNSAAGAVGGDASKRRSAKKKKRASGSTGNNSWKLTALEEEERSQQLGPITGLKHVSWKTLRRTFLRVRGKTTRTPPGRSIQILHILENRWPATVNKGRSLRGGNVGIHKMFPLQSCENDNQEYIGEKKLPFVRNTLDSGAVASALADNNSKSMEESSTTNRSKKPGAVHPFVPTAVNRSSVHSTTIPPPVPNLSDQPVALSSENQVAIAITTLEKNADTPSHRKGEILRNPYATLSTTGSNQTAGNLAPVRNPYSRAVSGTACGVTIDAPAETDVASRRQILQERGTVETICGSSAKEIARNPYAPIAGENPPSAASMAHMAAESGLAPLLPHHHGNAQQPEGKVAPFHDNIADAPLFPEPGTNHHDGFAPGNVSLAVEPAPRLTDPNLENALEHTGEPVHSYDRVLPKINEPITNHDDIAFKFRLPSPASSSSSSSEDEEEEDEDDNRVGMLIAKKETEAMNLEVPPADENEGTRPSSNNVDGRVVVETPQITFRLPTQDSSSSSDDESEAENGNSSVALSRADGNCSAEDSDSSEDAPLMSLRKRRDKPKGDDTLLNSCKKIKKDEISHGANSRKFSSLEGEVMNGNDSQVTGETKVSKESTNGHRNSLLVAAGGADATFFSTVRSLEEEDPPLISLRNQRKRADDKRTAAESLDEQDAPLISLRQREKDPPNFSEGAVAKLAATKNSDDESDSPLISLRKRKTTPTVKKKSDRNNSPGMHTNHTIATSTSADIQVTGAPSRNDSNVCDQKPPPEASSLFLDDMDENRDANIEPQAEQVASLSSAIEHGAAASEKCEVLDTQESSYVDGSPPTAAAVNRSRKRRHILETQSPSESQCFVSDSHSPVHAETNPKSNTLIFDSTKRIKLEGEKPSDVLSDTPKGPRLGNGSALTDTPVDTRDPSSFAEEIVCAVCFSPDTPDEDPIVLCDGKCGLAYHVSCYGITVDINSDDPWYCDQCFHREDVDGSEVTCIHCGNSDGPLRRLSSRSWHHPLCADFSCAGKNSLSPCFLCSKGGAKRCFSCNAAAHSHCAMQDCSVGKWTLARLERSNGSSQQMRSAIFCPRHTEQASNFLYEYDDPEASVRVIQTRVASESSCQRQSAKKLFEVNPMEDGSAMSSNISDVEPNPNSESGDRKKQLLQRRREVLDRFVMREADVDDDDDGVGDSAEEGMVRQMEEEELSQDSFINDSTNLTQHFSQDDLAGVDPDASAETDFQHRAIDAQLDRANQFTTPMLNRRMKQREDSQLSGSSQRGLGNMHFIRSVMEHHRNGGDAQDIETFYHNVAKEEAHKERDSSEWENP